MQTDAALGDEYARQLVTIGRRLRYFPEGHAGLQMSAAYRMADLIRLGRTEDVKRISEQMACL